jgi:lysophospholipid acyltransferase (LPLAT)-like uncharacterized protein
MKHEATLNFALSSMKLRSPWLIAFIAWMLAVTIRVWMRTLHIRIVSADGRAHPTDPATGRYLYAFWHETLLAPLATRPKARVLISQHADGELIAQVCQHLGIGVIRGSSARGGIQALFEMIRGPERPLHLAITPDGPRGPRRELQPGVVMVASQTGLAIVPIGVGFSRAWRVPSWDRFAVPLPFSTILGVIGEPMAIPQPLDRAGLHQHRDLVQARLLELTIAAEDWAERIRREGACARRPSFEPLQGLRKTA